jgi:hypothetical protein
MRWLYIVVIVLFVVATIVFDVVDGARSRHRSVIGWSS